MVDTPTLSLLIVLLAMMLTVFALGLSVLTEPRSDHRRRPKRLRLG